MRKLSSDRHLPASTTSTTATSTALTLTSTMLHPLVLQLVTSILVSILPRAALLLLLLLLLQLLSWLLLFLLCDVVCCSVLGRSLFPLTVPSSSRPVATALVLSSLLVSRRLIGVVSSRRAMLSRTSLSASFCFVARRVGLLLTRQPGWKPLSKTPAWISVGCVYRRYKSLALISVNHEH